MELSISNHCIISITKNSPFLFFSTRKPPFSLKTYNKRPPLYCSLVNSSESNSQSRLDLAHTLQSQTLKALEWSSLCTRLSPFTSTSLGRSATQNAAVPIGRTPEESRKLLDQTAAALAVLESGTKLNLSGVEDITGIVDSAASGTLLMVSELCAVRRTLTAARAVLDGLNDDGNSSDRYSSLREILESCNFQKELEQKIGFCVDCNFSIILDRASEELELIRSERKKNMENLDTLLKRISAKIFQGGGIDKPLVTRRRSRLCVGVRATHRHLVPDGVVLDVSSSGATYFMEPGEAVELNNLEVVLSNSERAEEISILSFLTNEIAESEKEIKHLLDCIKDVDIAFARAVYAQRINGVCPILTSKASEGMPSASGTDSGLSIDIQSIQHPLLLGKPRRSLSAVLGSNNGSSAELDEENNLVESISEFPVPISIQVKQGTSVVVISGPNTGGKTASMKTLGLGSLMSKAGLYLPAKNTPRLPWFDLVLADIGDHQSLEQNLSTFSGHISRIYNILEVASKESLVLLDEICSGTDPSEGVALATSILQYLGDRVSLAIVTTHYADLSRLKDKDSRFENAAMEFSIETLQPTYQILWGSTGNSNALNIARSIGFDRNIIEGAEKWMEKLTPEKQQERSSLLQQSLMEERNRLEAQAREAAYLNAKIMKLYHEIRDEAEDLDRRERALMAKDSQQVQQELKAAKSQMESVVQDFEYQLRTASRDEFNSLLKKSESAISAIVEAHYPVDSLPTNPTGISTYTPEFGEQVHVKGLGRKLATVAEAPGDDETVLIQYGKMKVRVKKSDIRAISKTRTRRNNASNSTIPRLKKQEQQSNSEVNKGVEVSYGPRVQTSKNTVDLRGMRAEEAALQLNIAISEREPYSVIFVVHGMGTGAVKERAMEILREHPRVTKYEPEDPLNFGCTVAYIK